MKSRIELVINGETVYIPIEITDEQVLQLTKAIKVENPPTGWELPEVGENCSYLTVFGDVATFEKTQNQIEYVEDLYNAANCFSSQLICENMARFAALYRNLKRLSVLSRTKGLDMVNSGGYSITFDYSKNCFECGLTGSWKGFGEILFDTEEAAQEAINLYRDELLWYFTQMRDKL